MNAPKIRVLMLEDSRDDIFFCERALRHKCWDFEVHAVMDKEAFLNELATFEPDLVISDINVPGFPGMQAFQAARKELPQLPFLFLTGDESQEGTSEIPEGATCLGKNDLTDLPQVVGDLLLG